MRQRFACPRPSSTIGLGVALIVAAGLSLPTALAQAPPPLPAGNDPGAIPGAVPTTPAEGAIVGPLGEFFPGMTAGTHPNPATSEDDDLLNSNRGFGGFGGGGFGGGGLGGGGLGGAGGSNNPAANPNGAGNPAGKPTTPGTVATTVGPQNPTAGIKPPGTPVLPGQAFGTTARPASPMVGSTVAARISPYRSAPIGVTPVPARMATRRPATALGSRPGSAAALNRRQGYTRPTFQGRTPGRSAAVHRPPVAVKALTHSGAPAAGGAHHGGGLGAGHHLGGLGMGHHGGMGMPAMPGGHGGGHR